MASAQENENKPSRAAEVNNKSDVKKRVGRAQYRETHGSKRGKESESMSVRDRARTEAL